MTLLHAATVDGRVRKGLSADSTLQSAREVVFIE